MRTSSASPLELDYSSPAPFLKVEQVNSESGSFGALTIGSPNATSAPSRLPDFSAYGQVYAVTSRMAGRLNAASVSEQEQNDLLQERKVLLDKKFNQTITRHEQNRLEYVRWSLDRIEDAKHGQALDALEYLVSNYESFLADIGRLDKQLQQHLRKKRK